eukprot:167778-Rhodomonas_salina.1
MCGGQGHPEGRHVWEPGLASGEKEHSHDRAREGAEVLLRALGEEVDPDHGVDGGDDEEDQERVEHGHDRSAAPPASA